MDHVEVSEVARVDALSVRAACAAAAASLDRRQRARLLRGGHRAPAVRPMARGERWGVTELSLVAEPEVLPERGMRDLGLHSMMAIAGVAVTAALGACGDDPAP